MKSQLSTKGKRDDAPPTFIPLSPRLRELLEANKIASHFPIVFGSGAVWHDMQFECLSCNRVLDDDAVRGFVSWPTPKTAVVEAAGVCKNCNLVTSFFYRLHSDMRVTAPRDGKWVTWQQAPDSALGRLVDWLSSLMPWRNK